MDQSSEYIVEAVNIRKEYRIGSSLLLALKDVSLQIKRGEVVAIIGPSGCGKTTLLNCLSGLDEIDRGSITFGGHALKALSDVQLTALRAHQMGFVFQTYNLLPVLSGVENVELPLLLCGVRSGETRKRAMRAIEQVGLTAWARHRPAEMSGGQRQRFAIARALATQPAIIWADEPTGALDSQTSQEIIALMLSLNQRNQQTFVWVTHAPEVAAQANRLHRMHDGLIVEDSQIAAGKASAVI